MALAKLIAKVIRTGKPQKLSKRQTRRFYDRFAAEMSAALKQLRGGGK